VLTCVAAVGKPQNIAMQVAVRAEDRIRIVKMASEKRP
jgi:hypothetical protein